MHAIASKPLLNGKKQKRQQAKKISHIVKPDGLTAVEWQRHLRTQAAAEAKFTIRNTGDGKVYSDYAVYNTATKNTYKVAIRSSDNTLNFCSCYDFKTNQLGTCKHIEAVLQQINRNSSLRKILREIYTPAYSSIYVNYRGQKKVMARIGTDNRQEFKNLFSKYFTASLELKKESIASFDKLLQKAYSINASFRCYEDALNLVIEEREKENRRKWLMPYQEQKVLPEINKLSVKPFPYQTEGILFCAIAGRSILADDMGLGKTLQAIATAELMHLHQNVQKVLIVCPTSLKYQWKTEIEKFVKGSSITVVEGHQLNRKRMYAETESLYTIVTYNIISNDWEYLNELLNPDLIILDEAQRIKNWKTKISQNVKKLKSRYALVLTGTPLENNLEELYSLVQFVNPLLLGSLYNFLSYHQVKEGGSGKVIGYQHLQEIAEKIKPVLLRRTKKQVLQQLPERTDTNRFITITKEQFQIHEEHKEIVAKLVLKWQRQHFLSEEDRQRLLINLNLMRMVCDSTYIMDQRTNYQTKVDELFNILDEVLIIEDTKVVIFSQWEKMTHLIAQELEIRNIQFEYLHGGVPSAKREGLYKRFNNEPQSKIFLSTDAGGVGLNLQTASYLINVDIPWNPAVLEQRIGRIYRYGQKKNVNIINLVAQGTIEHSMLDRLKFKSALAAGVLDNGESAIFMGESKFNQFISMVKDITTVKAAKSADKEEIFEEKASVNGQQKLLFEDDDVPVQKEENQPVQITPESDSLLRTGMSFIQQLTNVLSDEKATENLVKSITEKDTNGKTYLKIPVENENSIASMVHLMASLLKQLGQ